MVSVEHDGPGLSSGQWQVFHLAVARLRAQIPEGYDRIRYSGHFLANGCHSLATAYKHDGTSTIVNPLFDTNEAFRVLRAAMYRPGEGTWRNVLITVHADGSSQVQFTDTIMSDTQPYVDYVTDQHMFPVDEDKQSKKVKTRIALGVQWLRDHDERWYPQWLHDMIQTGNKPDWL